MTVTERTSVEEIRARLAATAEVTGGTVRVELTEPRTQLHLHADAEALRGAGERFGAAVPAASNTWTGPDPYLVWMAPGEYLLQSERGFDEVTAALAAAASAVVDVSSLRVAFDLAGPGARGLLASGCAIDLHPAAFKPGCSALTLFESTAVVLLQTSEEPAYRLLVRRSFCGYVAGLLLDATTELER